MTIAKLIELASQLPEGLHADWRDSNHYELRCQSDGDDYWWLDLSDLFKGTEIHNWCESEFGKRVGLLMDIAETLKAAEPELAALKKKLAAAEHVIQLAAGIPNDGSMDREWFDHFLRKYREEFYERASNEG